MPGAVLLASQGGKIEIFEAYGSARTFEYDSDGADPGNPETYGRARPAPDRIPMNRNTVFDLASVTKVMATTMAVMLLVDDGRVDVDAHVSGYLPDFTGGGKADITVRHLLTHRSGLSQWQPTYYHADSADEAYAWIRDFPLEWTVGEGRHYSDLGFMVLGRLVEAVTNQSLDGFLDGELYQPSGLSSTGFRPGETGGTGPYAHTSHGNPFERRMVHDPDFGYEIDLDPDSWEGWRTYTLAGEVNDGNAFHAFQGVAGHAGLFSTAEELHMLLQVLLGRGSYQGQRYFGPEVVDLFLTDSGEGQALGWQLPDYAPAGSFSHTGFTGTFVFGSPERETAIILLTNRQNVGVDESTSYPDVGPLQRAVVEALTRESRP